VAKRFTDTDKWKNPAFRDMEPDYRWLWIYILDTCDAAGIWRLDLRMAEFCIGTKFKAHEAQEYFQDKIIVVDHDKWFIPSFITFQYGELNEASKPHQSVIKNLIKHGIDPKNLTLSEGYPKGIHTLKEKDKDKEQAKDQDQDRGSAEGESLSTREVTAGLESVYKDYPRKEGKSPGMRTLKAQIKTAQDLSDLHAAVMRYRDNCKAKGKEQDFILLWSTFANQWRDWLDPETGQAESFAAKPSMTDAEYAAREAAIFADAEGA